jgi:L-ascorbate metabolism protein UlaG (beta-lactamase superfamily)
VPRPASKEVVAIRDLRGSGLNFSKIRSLAVEAAPMFWERYVRERKLQIADAPYRPDPGRWGGTGLHAAWLGHSTVLMKIDGTTIVTDPVLGARVGLTFGPVTVGVKRIVAPALTPKELPRPDIVLLSHAHMDHFDTPTLRALESKGTTVVTASKTSDLLRVDKFAAVHELGWGDSVQLGDILIRTFEVNHWGARMRSDTWRGYNGYLIETPRYRVLFGGDTAMTDTFRSLRTTRGIDLAIMPIGAYNPWLRAHCTPEQALKMANDAGADFFLPVHHQTFRLSQEPYAEPMERLVTVMASDPERLALQAIGQEFHL